jgi:hypothetical protein
MRMKSLAAIAAASVFSAAAHGQVFEYEFTLDGDREVPPVSTVGSGTASVTLDQGAGMISWEIHFQDLTGPATAAHFHGPAAIGEPAGVRLGISAISGTSSPMLGEAPISPAFAQEVIDGLWYVNIHTAMHSGGEIRGQVIDEVIEYRFTLDGGQEVPPVMTDGRGSATVVLDRGAGMISWDIEFSDLTGPATAAHFHGPAAIGEPAGVRLGIHDISGTSSPMIGEAPISAPFAQEVVDGLWYVNIHTAMHPGGEIRGQVVNDVTCYADCDESGELDFFDFLCFQNEFAGGMEYADCDASGELDFFDFLCFQNEFAAGCP